jgi:ribosomal 30S subunit maturation factor RimM
MATIDSDLVGLHAFSSDGARLGKVKRVLDIRGRRYIEIGGFLSRELIVPGEGVRKTTDERVELSYMSIYLDRAPEHRGNDEPTQEELVRVDKFYRTAA